MMKISHLVLVSLILAALLLSCPVLAWSDSMENQAVQSYIVPTGVTATWSTMYAASGGLSYWPDDLSGYKVVVSDGDWCKGLVSPKLSSPVTYVAGTTIGWPANYLSGTHYTSYFLYSSSFVPISGYYDYNIPDGHIHRFEVTKSAGVVRLYRDGDLKYTITGIADDAYYFAFGPGARAAEGGFVCDYSSTNAFSDTGVVSVMPHTYSIQKSILSPTQVLLKDPNGNTVYTDHFNIRWSLGPQADGWNMTTAPNTRYAIQVFTPGGYVAYNSYINITAAGAAAGIIRIPFNSTYIGNQPFEYGIYHVYLYDGGGTKSSDYFSVISSGASIYWGSTLYATGSTAIVTWNVDAGYWDTANYNYAIKVVDIYGNTKATYTVTTQSGSTTFSLSGYDAGVYYAELTATPTAGGTAAILYYAATEVTNYATFSPGFVNDETGAGISNATVFISQSGTNKTYTTAPNGSWIDTGSWLTGTAIQINTNKTGYTSDSQTVTLLNGGNIPKNITLVSTTAAHTGVAISGVVNSSQYGNPISGATVHIKVNGTSIVLATNTSNNAGYYIFNSLVNGTVYDLWSSKTGFFDSPMRQITAVGSL